MTTVSAGARTSGVGRLGKRAEDRYGLVLLLTVVTYVLASALPESGAAGAVIVAVQGITVLAALAASLAPIRIRRIAAALAAVAVIVGASSSAAGGTGSGVAGAIGALLLAAALVAILRRIATHERVTVQTLLGAISSYVLLGLIYAFAYAAIARIGSGQFFQSGADPTLSNFLFFSYTTLTTTGYGNLVPAQQFAQTVAVLEALTGQIYLVTVVARLVALWRRAPSGE